MAPRAIWKGRMGFGLVGLDVRLHKACEQDSVGFHMLHTCGGRIKYLYHCQKCEATLADRREIKKGYEFSKDQYVILEDSDLQSLPLKTVRSIEILGFTEESLDPRIMDTTYYLSPDKGGEKVFQLFKTVMERLGVQAIAKFVQREREHLVVVKPFDSIMLLQTMCFADELRDYKELAPKQATLSLKELELGETLVKKMTMVFDHSVFVNEYRQALEKLVEAKVTGVAQMPVVEAVELGNDLVAQLMASLS